MTAALQVLAVVPVRNEKEAIQPLLQRFEQAIAAVPFQLRVLIVDGESTDGTSELLKALASDLPVEVARLESDRGLGGALVFGLESALDQGADVIVTMDGDDSHDPALIDALVAELQNGHDVVIASRFAPGGREVGVAPHRRLLSHAASGLLRTLFPFDSARDYSSGYRAYRREALETVKERFGQLTEETGFSCMLDLLLKLRAAGASASEVGLVLRYDQKHSESKMDVWDTIKRYLAIIAANRAAGRAA